MEEGQVDTLSKEQHGKLAEWGERFALLVFGSLVLQQLVSSASIIVVILGIAVTFGAYAFAYSQLKVST